MACADPVIDAQAADFAAALNGAASWLVRPDGDLEIQAPTAILAVKGDAKHRRYTRRAMNGPRASVGRSRDAHRARS